jgi:hypothetical protein
MNPSATHSYNASITVQIAVGGFIVSYPKYEEGVEYPVYVQEVATSIGKAMRLVKTAAEQFSLVKKTADDAAE